MVACVLPSFPGTILVLEIGSLLEPRNYSQTTTTKEQECDLHQELSIWKLQQVVTPLG
jgi:hypothetical protein